MHHHRYMFKMQYRQWVGKPDPSGFGSYYMHTDDPDWGHKQTLKGEVILSMTDKMANQKPKQRKRRAPTA